MGRMPSSNDWKMLTLVGLADRLVARTSVEKDPLANNARKNRWSASKSILRFILKRFSRESSQDIAVQRLRNLDDARTKAIAAFKGRMPDGRARYKSALAKGASLAFEPAEPEVILKAFCFVALRVRSTATNAELEDIVWHSFRHVVAPQLAAHLFLIEGAFPEKSQWPKDHSAKGTSESKDTWSRPSDLLRSVADGSFGRALLQPSGPLLSLAEFKQTAAKYEYDCTQAALLLRVLLQFCANNDEDWKLAQGMAKVLLRQIADYGQQAHQALGYATRTDLSAATLAEFSDLASATIHAELHQTSTHLDRSLNLPQTRRRILSYTPYITDPSSAELDTDFEGAVTMLKARLVSGQRDDEWARSCMGYAYYMSRRCLIQVDGVAGAGEERLSTQAAELTYDLMARAFEIGAPATQQIALRYLAGFCTNPRFRCTALAQESAKGWIKQYEASSAKGLAKLFRARLAYAAGDNAKAVRLYQEIFMRALPAELSEASKRATAVLEDHEALAYLLPECYALAGELLGQKATRTDGETDLQRQIRRAGVAHFGIECNWQLEAKRILTGFAYRKNLLT